MRLIERQTTPADSHSRVRPRDRCHPAPPPILDPFPGRDPLYVLFGTGSLIQIKMMFTSSVIAMKFFYKRPKGRLARVRSGPFPTAAATRLPDFVMCCLPQIGISNRYRRGIAGASVPFRRA